MDNAKIKYIKRGNQDKKRLASLDEMIEAGAEFSSSVNIDTTAFLYVEDFEQLIENETLCFPILELLGKECQILSLHNIYKVPFTEITDLLEVNYKTVYSIYVRSLKKLKRNWVIKMSDELFEETLLAAKMGEKETIEKLLKCTDS